MKRDSLNASLRSVAKKLSPTLEEKSLISGVYSSFETLLSDGSCLQIGSYPRFTAITPLHDLDILYVLGEWNLNWSEGDYEPKEAILSLANRVKHDIALPAGCSLVSVKEQTHSVSAEIKCGGMSFSVDIVPAYSFKKNEFGEDMYHVPEIVYTSHKQRADTYIEKSISGKHVTWIKSDPRGYIKIAQNLGKNSDFRKAVKFVKKWKASLEAQNETAKLKSFHLEQVVTEYFSQYPSSDIFDAIFHFFTNFADTVLTPNRIKDRANHHLYIDDYIAELDADALRIIVEARDGFLIALESVKSGDDVENLVNVVRRSRKSISETYLFDMSPPIPVLTDATLDSFDLKAFITDKTGRQIRQLEKGGLIDSGRYLVFVKEKQPSNCDFFWKVKNDDSSEEPRGEITVGQTSNVPEHTKYKGTHSVECFAVQDGTCIARARQIVFIAREPLPKSFSK